MISRRLILKALAFSGLGALAARAQIARDIALYNGVKEPEDASPHQAALALVWEKEKKAIREIETKFAKAEQRKRKEYVDAESRWWFDTDDRDWTVYRPVGPGTLDSTHWFDVSFLINKKVVGRWHVDTREKSVVKSKSR